MLVWGPEFGLGGSAASNICAKEPPWNETPLFMTSPSSKISRCLVHEYLVFGLKPTAFDAQDAISGDGFWGCACVTMPRAVAIHRNLLKIRFPGILDA